MTSYPNNRLAGKTALITGAAQRLGRATALALGRLGIRIVIHYHQSAPQATAVCRELQDLNVAAWGLTADLCSADEAQDLFEQAVTLAGPIDILINNASIFPEETLWETNATSLQQNMQIHALAPLILSRRLAQQGRPGRIVNLLDTRVTSYDRKHATYHLSKRSLLTLTRMLALELAPQVTVNAVAPGLILPPAGQDDSYLQKLAHTNPMQCHGNPEDVAEAVVYLLQSRFITGQIIYVDGGRHLKGRLYE